MKEKEGKERERKRKRKRIWTENGVCVKFSFEWSLSSKTVDSLSKAQGTQFVLSQLFMKIKRVFILGARGRGDYYLFARHVMDFKKGNWCENRWKKKHVSTHPKVHDTHLHIDHVLWYRWFDADMHETRRQSRLQSSSDIKSLNL